MTHNEHKQNDTEAEVLDPQNPVDRQRMDTGKGVWQRIGDKFHGGVDTSGKVVKWGADVTETGTDHGKGIARPVGKAIGNVVRGTYELAAGVLSGIRGDPKKESRK